MKRLLFIVFLWNITSVGFSQEKGKADDYYPGKKERKHQEKTDIINQRIELLAETSESEVFDLTTVFETFYYLLEHPINLNFADKEELEQLEILSDIQINNFLLHRERNGKLMTIYEIQAIDGWDLELIRNILPFVKVNAELNTPHISFKGMMKNGSNELFLRYSDVVEQLEGFSPIEDSVLAKSPNRRYLGSSPKLYARYRYKFGTNISLGLTGEKDTGEEFFKGSQKQGFDFYSAHLYFKNIGKIKHLVIGDYQIMLGQGLTMWSGRAFNKTADVINVKKNPLTIKPYTSVDENLFMRGVAGTVKVSKFEITGYYSRNKRDANISDTDTLSGNSPTPIITSELTTGIHSTPAELADKDAITISDLGTHVRYVGKNIEIGGTGSFRGYSTAVNSDNSAPYAQYRSSGNSQLLNFGLDYNYIYKNFNLFGEVSKSLQGGSAILSGAIISLDPRLAISAIYRNYSRDYLYMQVNPFRESNAVNEKGLYVGAEAKINKAWKLSGYTDFFSYPWLRFGVSAPSKGVDYLAQLTYRPSRKIEMYVRYKNETKGKNGKIEVRDTLPSGFVTTSFDQYSGISEVVDANTMYLRYHVKYKMSDALTFGNRIQYKRYTLGNNTSSEGFMIYQDIKYKPFMKPYSFTFRYALFDTDSYDSRIYAYENDVLYYFSVPAYYNRGSKIYIVFRYKIVRGIDVWLKVAQTYYTNVNEIGSGLNTINGNTKTEIRGQLRIKF